MKNLLRLVATNWLHLPGFLTAIYIYQFAYLDTGGGIRYVFYQAAILFPIGTVYTLFIWGLPFLFGIFVILGFSDTVLLRRSAISTAGAILLQCVILMPPFVYWAFVYEYWLWLVLCISFVITQVVKAKVVAASVVSYPL